MGKYKEAYYRLQPMYKKYPDQNELKLLMDEALDRGMYRIGIVSDPNLTGKEATIRAAVQSRLISELYRLERPFWSSLTVQILTSSRGTRSHCAGNDF